jgi:DNA-directed RNA polymerase subunit K/omega
MKPVKKLDASKEAKQLAAMILDVLAGVRTPPVAAESLAISLPRYYQLEDRAFNGLLAACEARPRGRQASSESQVRSLLKEVDRLRAELTRYQSLVRLTQRTVGVSPPPPPSKETGKKRKRKPVVRAMRRADKLREEAKQMVDPSTNGVTEPE